MSHTAVKPAPSLTPLRRKLHLQLRLLILPAIIFALMAALVMKGCAAASRGEAVASSNDGAAPSDALMSPAAPSKAVVAVILFDGVELLDFAGPGEVFAACRPEEGPAFYDVRTVGSSTKPVTSVEAFTLAPRHGPGDAPDAAIVVIPGGNVIPTMNDAALMGWIKRQADRGAIMFSVCNGASVLAKLGVLEGREVTTHHANIEILKLLDPSVRVRNDCRFVDHGSVITAGGVSAGIDAALHLVERLHGTEVARRTATGMEYQHWSGFAPGGGVAVRSAEGSLSQPGRAYTPPRWAVMELLAIIREQGVGAAVEAYPAMLAATRGHDREMIEEPGLDEAFWWVMTNTRDPEIGLNALRFIAAAYPESASAHARLGEALIFANRTQEAVAALQRALAIDPAHPKAQRLLEQARRTSPHASARGTSVVSMKVVEIG